MAITPINLTGIDSWFDYADLIQDLADVIDEIRRHLRDKLSTIEKEKLRFFSEKFRNDARTLATVAGEALLNSLQPELDKLTEQVKKLNGFLKTITDTSEIISTLATAFEVVTNILRLIPVTMA